MDGGRPAATMLTTASKTCGASAAARKVSVGVLSDAEVATRFAVTPVGSPFTLNAMAVCAAPLVVCSASGTWTLPPAATVTAAGLAKTVKSCASYRTVSHLLVAFEYSSCTW